jgi:hypothetical protein
MWALVNVYCNSRTANPVEFAMSDPAYDADPMEKLQMAQTMLQLREGMKK